MPNERSSQLELQVLRLSPVLAQFLRPPAELAHLVRGHGIVTVAIAK